MNPSSFPEQLSSNEKETSEESPEEVIARIRAKAVEAKQRAEKAHKWLQELKKNPKATKSQLEMAQRAFVQAQIDLVELEVLLEHLQMPDQENETEHVGEVTI